MACSGCANLHMPCATGFEVGVHSGASDIDPATGQYNTRGLYIGGDVRAHFDLTGACEWEEYE